MVAESGFYSQINVNVLENCKAVSMGDDFEKIDAAILIAQVWDLKIK